MILACLASALQVVDARMFVCGIFDSRIGEICSMLGFSWQLGGILCVLLLIAYGFHMLVVRVFALKLTSKIRYIFILYWLLSTCWHLPSMYNGWLSGVITQDSHSAKRQEINNAMVFFDLHLGNVYNLSLQNVLTKVQHEKPNVLLDRGRFV